MAAKILILSAVAACLLGAGFAPPEEWAPKAFPISFWCGPPEPTVERYREVAAAGFNYLMPPCEGASTPERNRNILDAARATGLKAFLQDSRMPLSLTGQPDAKKQLDAIVADYAKHPAFAGYFLTDEPGASAFKGLGEVVAYLREKDPKHPAYINLFPNYATPDQLGEPTYDVYVSHFLRDVKPFAVSYDHYNFLKTGDRPEFFANLDSVRTLALEAHTPFWQIVLSVPHGPYRPLTEAEKRWEAMQTLAYGAKGLMYFTYWTPGDNSFNWGPAIIGRDGKPTPQYEEVSRINADVRTLGKYLIDAIPSGVFQSGSVAPGGKPREQGTPVRFAGPGDITIGLFMRDTHLYVLMANRDYKKATTAEAILSNGEHDAEKLDKRSGKWSGVKGKKDDDGDLHAKVELAPGDADLYRW